VRLLAARWPRTRSPVFNAAHKQKLRADQRKRSVLGEPLEQGRGSFMSAVFRTLCIETCELTAEPDQPLVV
jgi:hypothetical protein